MSLRTRLGLTLVALTLPLGLALVFLQSHLEQRSEDKTASDLILSRMLSGDRERCEADAEWWPAPRPLHLRTFGGSDPQRGPRGRRWRRGGMATWDEPPSSMRGRRGRREGRGRRPMRDARVFAYDVNLVSMNPEAPALDSALATELETGTDFIVTDTEVAGQSRRLLMVPMQWTDGPCAVVAMMRPPPALSMRFDNLVVPVAISLAAMLIAFFAAGPLVRRIRLLTRQVRASGLGGESPISVQGSDEVAQLSQAFEESRQEIRGQVKRLRDRDETLTRHIANTTHDVMLPLTVLQGHLVALRRDSEAGRTVSPSSISSALEESHYLGSLLHNLNAAAKLEAGEHHVERHPVDMGALVERVYARHQSVAASRGVHLNHAVPEDKLEVDGDVTLIEQAINNLVHNAIRYNHVDGHVALLLEPAARGFRLTVLDDGPGVSPEDLLSLGNRRFRSDEARTREPSGKGIGLSIARDVVERHGWRLEFSREEPGLRATITSR